MLSTWLRLGLAVALVPVHVLQFFVPVQKKQRMVHWGSFLVTFTSIILFVLEATWYTWRAFLVLISVMAVAALCTAAYVVFIVSTGLAMSVQRCVRRRRSVAAAKQEFRTEMLLFGTPVLVFAGVRIITMVAILATDRMVFASVYRLSLGIALLFYTGLSVTLFIRFKFLTDRTLAGYSVTPSEADGSIAGQGDRRLRELRLVKTRIVTLIALYSILGGGGAVFMLFQVPMEFARPKYQRYSAFWSAAYGSGDFNIPSLILFAPFLFSVVVLWYAWGSLSKLRCCQWCGGEQDHESDSRGSTNAFGRTANGSKTARSPSDGLSLRQNRAQSAGTDVKIKISLRGDHTESRASPNPSRTVGGELLLAHSASPRRPSTILVHHPHTNHGVAFELSDRADTPQLAADPAKAGGDGVGGGGELTVHKQQEQGTQRSPVAAASLLEISKTKSSTRTSSSSARAESMSLQS